MLQLNIKPTHRLSIVYISQRYAASLNDSKLKRWKIYDKKSNSVSYNDYEIMKLPTNLVHNPGIARRAFIRDAMRIHGNQFQYDQVTYDGEMSKTHTIICPFHGPFKMSVRDHIMKRKGCPSCSDNIRLPVTEFLTKSNNARRRIELANDLIMNHGLNSSSVPSLSTQNSPTSSEDIPHYQLSSSSDKHVIPISSNSKIDGDDVATVENSNLSWASKVDKDSQASTLAELRTIIPFEVRKDMFKTLESADLSTKDNSLVIPPSDIKPAMGKDEVSHQLSKFRDNDELSILREAQGGDKYLRGEREALKGSIDKAHYTFLEDAKNALGEDGRRLTFDESVYLGPHHPIQVRCETHGDFSTTPSNLIVKRIGCPQCVKERKDLAKQKALDKFNKKKREFTEP